MSERKEKSSDGDGAPAITVQRLVPTEGITVRQIVRAVESALAGRPVQSLSIAVVSDADIARLHERYLDEPGPTDVLSFDLRDSDDGNGNPVDGEVVVSIDTARRQALRFGVTESDELLRYVIHGTLHLLGMDDRTPAQRSRMRREENRILAGLSGRRATARRARAASRNIGGTPVSPGRRSRIGRANKRG